MDKQKQIEEMAHKLCKSKSPCIECLRKSRDNGFFINKEDCKCYLHAKILSKHYQPKLPEGSVVLTEEEYERLERSNFQEGMSEGRKEVKDMYDSLHLRQAEILIENKKLKASNKVLTDRNFTLSIRLEQARKKALNLAFILSEVIEKLNVCTLKLENKSQEFTDGYTEAIAEVRNSLKELLKNVGIAIKE